MSGDAGSSCQKTENGNGTAIEGKMHITIDYPDDYLCVCFTELAEPENSYVSEIKSFGTYDEAAQYGQNWCRSLLGYPAEAHFYIWKFCDE